MILTELTMQLAYNGYRKSEAYDIRSKQLTQAQLAFDWYPMTFP